MKHNFGGLVLTVKPDEKDTWVEYCKHTAREKDLLIIEPGSKFFFNFLNYEASRTSNNNAVTGNIVEVLKTVIRAGDEKDSGKSDDAFWQSALDMLIYNVIDLCRLAYGELSLQVMFEIVQTTLKQDEKLQPASEALNFKAFQKAVEKARKNILAKKDKWEESLTTRQSTSYDFDPDLYELKLMEAVPEARVFRFIDQFFFDSFKKLSDKTRSIIDFRFSGFLFRLLRDPVFSLFCRYESNFSPDDSLEGKIILINLPVKLYHKIGQDCQILFKYIWQRRMEQRDININDRPLFLWADEAQNFLHEHDADFQATARSSRVATVYLSQNLPNYYASMGGDVAAFKVKSFLGTLNTKIFHANADIETNEYASKLIGDEFVEEVSSTVNVVKDFSQGQTKSIKLERIIRPETFVSFRTGGKNNDYSCDSVLHRQGEPITKKHNHKTMAFKQTYKP